MAVDVYSGLSEEYREYTVIRPEQLNFRPVSDDAERRAARVVTTRMGKDTILEFIIGAVMIAIGVFAPIGTDVGAFALISFGIIMILLGIISLIRCLSPKKVAVGVLLKKEPERNIGTSNDEEYIRELVLEVEEAEKTLCVIDVKTPAEYNEAEVGDRLLLVKDNRIRVKKI